MPRGMSASSRRRVLLVDSERRSELGADFEWSGSEERALERLSEEAFDALVVRLDAPRIDALGVVCSVRAHGPTAKMPILALTDVDDPTVAELALSRGCDRLLGGAVDADGLLASLRELVDEPAAV